MEPNLEPSEYLDALRNRSAAFFSGLESDVNKPVPSCPGWTVRDLVDHLGSTWAWAAAIIETGSRADAPSAAAGAKPDELVEWAAAQARAVIAALEHADPVTDCWTFGMPRSRLFWFRRQALESAVHAWDRQRAAGIPEPIDAELACDGIDEFLSVLLPRKVKDQPEQWSGQSIHLHRNDGEGEWMIQIGPDAVVSAQRAHGKGDVALRGSASALYLWTLNRISSDELEIFGDRELADRWTSNITF